MEINIGFKGGVLCTILYSFMGIYIIVAYPDFADVYAHFVLCVYLGVEVGVGVGWKFFPPHPTKKKGHGSVHTAFCAYC